jgi:hypothetical protein
MSFFSDKALKASYLISSINVLALCNCTPRQASLLVLCHLTRERKAFPFPSFLWLAFSSFPLPFSVILFISILIYSVYFLELNDNLLRFQSHLKKEKFYYYFCILILVFEDVHLQKYLFICILHHYHHSLLKYFESCFDAYFYLFLVFNLHFY